MNSGPSTFRGNGAGCSSKFESLPDISRKLDTIMQLLRNNSENHTIQQLVSQQEEILNRLDQLTNQQSFTPTQNCVSQPAGDARTTLLQNQQWGQTDLNQNDPITSMNNGTNNWHNLQVDSLWHQQDIQPTEPITVPINQNNNQVVNMLENIQRKLNEPSKISSSKDANSALLNINEELSSLRESLTLGDNDYLQQIYNTLEQLVNQCNDNSATLNTLQSGLSDIYNALNENNSERNVSQIIEANESLRAYIQRLIETIRNR